MLHKPPRTHLTQSKACTMFLCRSIGCLCPDCELCKQAQHRRCTSCFGSKYLSGDALKAKCGAPIMVEIINPRTGDVVSTDKISDIQLEVRQATTSCHQHCMAYSQQKLEGQGVHIYFKI